MKSLSRIGFLGMVAGILGLVATRSPFSASPVVIVLQAAAYATRLKRVAPFVY